MKGACDPLVGDTPRIGVKRQIGSRNLWENAKRQVWNTILKRDIQRQWDTSTYVMLVQSPVMIRGLVGPFRWLVHERWESSSDPSIIGHLRYPNDIDRSLNEVAADKSVSS
jgi:hypothetical protein